MYSFQRHAISLVRTILGLSFAIAAQAQAAEIRILDVRATNDATIPARTLVLDVDSQGELTGLKILTAGQGVTSNYSAEIFRSGAIVLFQSEPDMLAPNGRDIIRLDARLVALEKGGPVRMDYAINALTGNFDSVRLDLDRVDADQWQLKMNGRAVKTLLMSRGALGIKEIEFR